LVKSFKKQLQKNPQAKMNVYLEETAYLYHLGTFVKQKIPTENYTVTIVGGGWLIFGGFERLMSDKRVWDKELKKYKKQFNAFVKTPLPFIPATAISDIDFCAFCDSVVDNVEYWVSNADYLPEPINELKSEREKMQIKKTSPKDIIEKLSEEENRDYLHTIGVDKDYFDKLFLSSSKRSLIITDAWASINKGRFHIVGEKIVEEYGNEFRIFYKPHPEHLLLSRAQAETEVFLNAHGIVKLPSDVPIEAVLYEYPELCIGGYKSSLYSLIKGDRVRFFIAKSMDLNIDNADNHISEDWYDLYKLLERLYTSGAYKNAKLFWE
jgi:uridine kinase